LGDKISLIQEETHQKISKLAADLNEANSALNDHIKDVEAIVEEKARDIKTILANIPQGIFMISAHDSMITPDYSAQLCGILGTCTIAGLSVREILLSHSDLSTDQINQTETVIMSALGDHILNFEINQDPRDVTPLRILECQREEQQCELEAIAKVLNVPGDRFSNFLSTCDDFMGSCGNILDREKTLNMQSINMLFLNIHTLKGMA
jgi:hypothetical protein